MVLTTLEAMGPMHGYGIARRIEGTSSRGTLSRGTLTLEHWNPGTLEPRRGSKERPVICCPGGGPVVRARNCRPSRTTAGHLVTEGTAETWNPGT
jgi:hypothetical protein